MAPADQLVVHLDRSAAAVDDPAHGDPVGVGLVGVSAQGSTGEVGRKQMDVEVCTGMPPWQRSAVGGRIVLHHVLVVCHHLTVGTVNMMTRSGSGAVSPS